MILLPIGRDKAVIQRHAWVTYGIIGLYFLSFAIMSISHAGQERSFVEDARAIELILAKYPYLEVPKQLEVIMGKEKFEEIKREQPGRPQFGIDRKMASDAQKRLDALAASAVDHYRNLGQLKYAYSPTESSLWKVLISMWAQFSFLALLADCFVLFSTAPYVEDAFGRPAFAMLYLGGAFAAATIYGLLAPDPSVPMFGAAGAISAVIGAFLVRFYKSSLEFLFVPFIWRPQHRFRFYVPAWIAIPLWLVLQLWVSTKQYGGGAYANLGGFAFGAFFAAGLKFSKYEEKFIAPEIAKETTWTLNEHLTRALEATDPQIAQSELAAFFPLKPANEEELQTAIDLIKEALEASPSAAFAAQAAAFADRHRAYDLATVAYDRACQLDPAGPNTVRHLMRLGSLKKQAGDVIGARMALMKAKSHSACSAEIRATIDARLAQMQA